MVRTFCPSCGADIRNRDGPLCPSCGERVEPPPPGDPKISDRIVVIIAILAFFIIFIEAPVLTYLFIGAGLFDTPPAGQDASHGVPPPSSLMIVRDMYGDSSGTADPGLGPPRIHTLFFNLSLSPGGSPVDLNRTTISYESRFGRHDLGFASTLNRPGVQPADFQWAILSGEHEDGDTVLEESEHLLIQANLSLSPADGLRQGDQFTLSIQPDVGAALTTTRWLAPSEIRGAGHILYDLF
jgi:archaellin